ncbi:MAG TPA: hypothetical protein VFS40_01800 [Gemmatimonadales bacterium]|nr:hypothetical protein [Gemmatimonadales bacterium]
MTQHTRAGLALFALAVLGSAGARAARAQALGIPVNNSGVATGLALYADAAFPNAGWGKGTAFALTGKLGFGRLGATAMVSRYDPSVATVTTGDAVVSAGATLNYKLLGGPLIPLSATLQGGAGYWKQDLVGGTGLPTGSRTYWRFPVGLGVGLNIPGPAFSLRPWIAPRVDVTHVGPASGAPAGTSGETTTSFALSAGAELNLLSGLGLQAAYDWYGDAPHPQIFAVGAHYALRIPGL